MTFAGNGHISCAKEDGAMEKNAVVRWLRQTAAALLLALLCCNAAFAAQDYLIPGGFAVGIELRTHGILISEVKPGSSAAAACSSFWPA